MPPSGDSVFALPSAGGLEHPAGDIPSHLLSGITDAAFMAAAIDLQTACTTGNGRLSLRVRVRNTGAGHAYPTDHPGRHLLLEVEAEDSDGHQLPLLDGPLLPSWAGTLAGKPGRAFARILRDVSTGESPVVSYWKPTLEVSDSRIPAGGEGSASFDFKWDGGTVSIRTRLRFRRLFEPIARHYGWDEGEIILKEVRNEIPER